MKYSVCIKYKDGSNAYLAVKGKSEWSIRTAKRHLDAVSKELGENNTKWVNVDYFTCVLN